MAWKLSCPQNDVSYVKWDSNHSFTHGRTFQFLRVFNTFHNNETCILHRLRIQILHILKVVKIHEFSEF